MIRFIEIRSGKAYIDGFLMDGLEGILYSTCVQDVADYLRTRREPFRVKGSPSRGMTEIYGRGYRVIDCCRAWLTSRDFNEAYETMHAIYDILGPAFKYTAAGTFIKIFGKQRPVNKKLRRFFYRAFTGGTQWCRRGVAEHVNVYDINDAYGWAMHANPLPDRWEIKHGTGWGPDCMVSCIVYLQGKTDFPILPVKGFHKNLYHNEEGALPGFWYGHDLETAMDSGMVDDIDVFWYAKPKGHINLQEIFDVQALPKFVRKPLCVSGYGVNAMVDVEWRGVNVEHPDDAIEIMKASNALRHMSGVWWANKPRYRPQVRIDWGGLVTARVRRQIMSDALDHGIENVHRIYVDSIATTQEMETSNVRGGYKLDNQGRGVFLSPGICQIGNKLKHSGVSEGYARKLMQNVEEGIYEGIFLPGVTEWDGTHIML